MGDRLPGDPGLGDGLPGAGGTDDECVRTTTRAPEHNRNGAAVTVCAEQQIVAVEPAIVVRAIGGRPESGSTTGSQPEPEPEACEWASDAGAGEARVGDAPRRT